MSSLFIFDIDGTVIDSVGPHQAAFLDALESFGFDSIETDWDRYAHHTDSWIFRQNLLSHLGREPTSADLDRLDRFMESRLMSLKPATAMTVTDGFDEFVRSAIEAGHSIAFATGSMRLAALYKLRLVGLRIDAPLVTASEYLEREQIVAAAAREVTCASGLSAFDRVVCFGDGRWDLAAAQALGFEFLGITAFSQKLAGLVAPQLLHKSFRPLCRPGGSLRLDTLPSATEYERQIRSPEC